MTGLDARFLPLVNLAPPCGSQRTTPATHGNRALTESQKDPFLGRRRAAPVPTTVLSEIGTRMYLRAAKEAHEFTVNVLSEKFRRASRLMKHANTTDPSSMIWRIMTRDARKQLDRYFDAIEYALDHHI